MSIVSTPNMVGNHNQRTYAESYAASVRPHNQQVVRESLQYARPSRPSLGAEAPRAAQPTAPDCNVAVGSHGEYVPTATAAAA